MSRSKQICRCADSASCRTIEQSFCRWSLALAICAITVSCFVHLLVALEQLSTLLGKEGKEKSEGQYWDARGVHRVRQSKLSYSIQYHLFKACCSERSGRTWICIVTPPHIHISSYRNPRDVIAVYKKYGSSNHCRKCIRASQLHHEYTLERNTN